MLTLPLRPRSVKFDDAMMATKFLLKRGKWGHPAPRPTNLTDYVALNRNKSVAEQTFNGYSCTETSGSTPQSTPQSTPAP